MNRMRVCHHCQESFRLASTGRPPRYCSATCRKAAWEARKLAEAVAVAAAKAVAAERRRVSRAANRGNETPIWAGNRGNETPVQATAAPSGDFLLAPPAATPQEHPDAAVLPTAWRADPPAPRRRLSRNRSESADALPLWPSEEYGVDGGASSAADPR